MAKDGRGVHSDMHNLVAPTLIGGARPQGGYSADDVPMVAHSLRGEGFDASEDGTGRGVPLVCDTLTSNGDAHSGFRDEKGHVPIAFNLRGREGGAMPEVSEHASLRAASGGSSRSYVAFDTTQVTSKANGSNPQPGDPCHPLAAGAHAPAVAFNITPSNSNKDYNARVTGRSQAITAGGNRPSARGGDMVLTLAIRGRSDGHNLETRDDGTANAILTPNGGRAGIGVGAIATASAVRRLTPTECERLQGFPDGYTLIPWRKAMAADGPRYKALGNSMAVPVMSWIGQRIAMVDALQSQQREAA